MHILLARIVVTDGCPARGLAVQTLASVESVLVLRILEIAV